MQLSASLALTALLAARDPAPAAAARPPRDAAALARRLQRAEAGRGTSPAPPAAASYAAGRTGNLGRTHAQVDEFFNSQTNTKGVALVRAGEAWDSMRYAYGDEVAVSFEVIAAEMDQTVLALLDANTMDGWRVGLYQRMQTPSGPPIVAVTPRFDRRRLQRGGGKAAVGAEGADADDVAILGGTEDTTAAGGRGGGGPGSDAGSDGGRGGGKEPSPPAAHSGDDADADPDRETSPYTDPDDDGVGGFGVQNVVAPPAFPLTGSATFSAYQTSATSLKEALYGTGFDAYLLTADHVPIVGPCTFYLPGGVAPGGEAESAGLYGMSASSNAQSAEDYGLVQFAIESSLAHATAAAAAAAAAGPGTQSVASAPDDAPVIATHESLATFLLESDKPLYRAGETVRVTYDIRPDLGAPAPAPAPAPAGGRGGGKVDRQLRAKAKAKENQGAAPAGTYGSVATSRVTSARGGGKAPAADAGADAVGGGRGGGKADAGDIAVTGGRGGGKDEGAAADGDAAAPGGRGGGKGDDEGTQVGDELPPGEDADETTTTTTLPPLPPGEDEDERAATTTVATVDMSANDPNDMAGEFVGQATEDEDPDLAPVDASDPTGYKIAVMMSHARGGGNVILEVPLCPGGAGACSVASVLTGTVEFRVDDLDQEQNANGYSVWVLDAADGEVAGPYIFSLAPVA